jgi:hypothetical protein
MSAREMTDRLFTRVMTLHQQGLSDSARLIANTMAIPAFDFHDSLDLGLRYALARIAEVAGAPGIARAQADTILLEAPNHLLGLVLSIQLARASGDSSTMKRLQLQLLAAEKEERARQRPEYSQHRDDIDDAIVAARAGGTN